MCIYGNIMKKEIQEEKIKNPENFIEIENPLKKEKDNIGLFALGLLAKNLENIGVETAIESENINRIDGNEKDAGITCLQFISNGMISRKKYDLYFDFGKKRNKEILNKKEEFNKFKEQLKIKISKDYNISPDKIIVVFIEKTSIKAQVIFQSEEFNDLEKVEFINKFKNDDEFEELKNLKEVHSNLIMAGCRLNKNQLDNLGNRSTGWSIGEYRGALPYDPPLGWFGIGLNILDKYENNIWTGMTNKEGEWCLAYNIIGRPSDSVEKILKNVFKKGWRQPHSECEDILHKGKKVGEGIYCTPYINTAEIYAQISVLSNGESYKIVLMVRVNPKALRHYQCENAKDYWVVNGTPDEIRAYRILIKKCN